MTREPNRAGATLPLGMARPGEIVEVVAIQGSHEVHRRLTDMGLTTGTRVRVVQGDGAGPMILAFKDDARLAVGRGVALKIIVTPQRGY
ncbi:MAG: ferrous iron transport protein A [Caldilineaceae bacterium]|nr:ferrous iron transport protein A [Caldilineaceae bacterium]